MDDGRETVGSEEKNITGEVTFRWLPGGFFLENHTILNFMGTEVDALELIGYDPETKTFPSTVFSNFSPTPLPYEWGIGDDTLTISVSYGELDARFEGKFGADSHSFEGGWRPNPGADENINVPYDIRAERVR